MVCNVRLAEQQALDKARQMADQSPNDQQKQQLKQQIRDLLKQHNAVMVAHYYTDPELQALAEETGGVVADSL